VRDEDRRYGFVVVPQLALRDPVLRPQHAVRARQAYLLVARAEDAVAHVTSSGSSAVPSGGAADAVAVSAGERSRLLSRRNGAATAWNAAPIANDVA